MPVIYLRHPEHGAHIVYNEVELAEHKKAGWVEARVECDEDSPLPARPAAPVEESPRPVLHAAKRGPGRPRKVA